MRLLDLFCCAGGAAKGYADAGFEVVGVDINPQPHYPYEFHQSDALTYPLDGFEVIHASPPCQAYSATRWVGNNLDAPRLIEPARERLAASGKPYIIENVVGAPLKDPLLLCGLMFGTLLYEHRLFETSFPAASIEHPQHSWRTTKMGRPPKNDECLQVVGHFSGVSEAKSRMRTPWMTQYELSQAIIPAYTEYIGKEFLRNFKEH